MDYTTVCICTLNEYPCGRRQGTGSSQDHTEASLRRGEHMTVITYVYVIT